MLNILLCDEKYEVDKKSHNHIIPKDSNYSMRKSTLEILCYIPKDYLKCETTTWPMLDYGTPIDIEYIGDNNKLFSNINNAIENAKKHLELKEDWDGEGSKGYKKETLNRVDQFLQDCQNFLFNKYNYKIPIHKIYPGPNGSFDILWITDNFKLLVNVPEDLQKPISYYGQENDGIEYIKGAIKSESHSLQKKKNNKIALFLWLYEELKDGKI